MTTRGACRGRRLGATVGRAHTAPTVHGGPGDQDVETERSQSSAKEGGPGREVGAEDSGWGAGRVEADERD